MLFNGHCSLCCVDHQWWCLGWESFQVICKTQIRCWLPAQRPNGHFVVKFSWFPMGLWWYGHCRFFSSTATTRWALQQASQDVINQIFLAESLNSRSVSEWTNIVNPRKSIGNGRDASLHRFFWHRIKAGRPFAASNSGGRVGLPALGWGWNPNHRWISS